MNCTCILAHQNTTAEGNVPGGRRGGRGRRGGSFEGKHYIFVGDGGAVFCFLSNLWAVGFCENVYFYAVVVLLKNAVLWVSFVQMGSF